jgi:cobalt-zinc-cadmium efflux system membrane fusion protein
VPTALVLAGLGAVAYWGHASGWQVAPTPNPTEAPAANAAQPVVRVTPTVGDTLPISGKAVSIQFGSAAAVDAAGIVVAPAWHATLTEQASAAGEVGFVPTRLAHVSARAAGTTRRVFKTAGDAVTAGELLALVDAAVTGRTKAELQQALVQLRLRTRARDDVAGAAPAVSGAAVREAAAALAEAEVRVLAAAQALANLGLPVEPAAFRNLTPAEAADRLRRLGLETTGTGLGPDDVTSNLLPVRAPLAGVVLSADVVAGEVVEAGKPLFTVVDPARVWVTLHLAAEDAKRAAVGQKAFFRPDGGDREHPAAVVWVGTAADEATRTVPVRAEADNAAGRLRAAALGRGRVVFREEPKAVVVPHAAVHPFRGRAVVFVRDPAYFQPGGPKAFHARAVVTGGRDLTSTEIVSGVTPGEAVATAGSARLLAELDRAAGD